MNNNVNIILNESREFYTAFNNDTVNAGIFSIRSANDVIKEASERADPKKLWGSLWYEGEVCCLFADSNVGKSIYAVQIADSIARSGKKVLYFDFELSDKQFQLRYTDEDKNLYQFSPNLYRVEINKESIVDTNFEESIHESIEYSIFSTQAKVLIIDNLTYLCLNSEKSEAASELMLRLIGLKRNHDLSILVLAHTPKRPMTSPITQNDLAGSKKLINFFDSAFAIGKSIKDEGLRYIKQIKVRYGEFSYHSENVIVASIEKQGPFTRFVSQGFSAEREHLKEPNEEDKAAIIEEVKKLSSSGKSQREISTMLGISVGSVNNYLKK